jgi:hypothetical protein
VQVDARAHLEPGVLEVANDQRIAKVAAEEMQ